MKKHWTEYFEKFGFKYLIENYKPLDSEQVKELNNLLQNEIFINCGIKYTNENIKLFTDILQLYNTISFTKWAKGKQINDRSKGINEIYNFMEYYKKEKPEAITLTLQKGKHKCKIENSLSKEITASIMKVIISEFWWIKDGGKINIPNGAPVNQKISTERVFAKHFKELLEIEFKMKLSDIQYFIGHFTAIIENEFQYEVKQSTTNTKENHHCKHIKK
jgi:hypothetical protein